MTKNLSKLDTYVVLHFHNQRYNYILPYEIANAIYKGQEYWSIHPWHTAIVREQC